MNFGTGQTCVGEGVFGPQQVLGKVVALFVSLAKNFLGSCVWAESRSKRALLGLGVHRKARK